MKTPQKFLTKKNSIFLLAILLSPFFALTLLHALFGYAPLGETPAQMAGDAKYLSFLSSLHSAFSGKGFFDFSSLASDASHLFARYAGSPFTWLLALLPDTYHASAAFLALALKSGFAALACAFYLSHRRPTLAKSYLFILSFAFSLPACLSLSSGMALFAEQLILLPLLLLALERFFADGKSLLLILSLTFLFLTGYAVCYATLIFAVIPLVLAFFEGRIKCTDAKGATVKLLFYLAVSVLLAAPILINALMHIGSVGSLTFYSGSYFYRLPLLLLTFLPGVTLPEFPVFYIGLLPVLLLPLFFASRAFTRRYRVSFAVALFLLCAFFFFFNPLGGALAFGLSFPVLLASADFLSVQDSGNKLCLTLSSAILLLLPMLLQKIAYRVPTGNEETEILSSLYGVYIPLALVLLASLVLSALFAHQKPTRALSALLILIVLLDGYAATFSRTSGKTFLETEKATLTDVAEVSDRLLLRAEQTLSPIERTRLFLRKNAKIPYNRAYLLNAEDEDALSPALSRTLKLLGYDMQGARDVTPFRLGDYFLGVSHYIADTPLSENGYYALETVDDYTLYSANALPTVFAASQDILKLDFKGSSPFLYTNAFLSAILGEETAFYRPLDLVTVTEQENGISLNGTAPSSGILCYYGEKIGPSNLNLTANGISARPYADGKACGIRTFGKLTSGSSVNATMNGAYPLNTENVRIADSNTLNDALARITATKLKNAALKGNLLTGEITLTEKASVLMTTLPYDAGYTVKIDGEIVKGENADGFLAVTAGVGTHTVSIERPAKLGIALLPTGIGFALTLSALVLLFAKNTKEKREMTK